MAIAAKQENASENLMLISETHLTIKIHLLLRRKSQKCDRYCCEDCKFGKASEGYVAEGSVTNINEDEAPLLISTDGSYKRHDRSAGWGVAYYPQK